jgi:ParB family chromosome partitioning protein
VELLYLDPRNLDEDPDGVRDDPGDVSGLAATIAEQGLLQPLAVVRTAQGRYQVVYGNRRRAAAIQLGLERVPCILLGDSASDNLLQQLTENVQRKDLNDIEQGRAFARLRQLFAEKLGNVGEGELNAATAKAVGLSPRSVQRYLGLLELPDEVQQMIRRGELTVTQAQHLFRIKNSRTQVELAQAAIDEGMSAAELSKLSSYFAANPNLTLDTALQALQEGQELMTSSGIETPVVGGGPLGKTSVSSVDLEDNEDYWDDEEEPKDEGGFLSVEEETIENRPANKARVFRIRSLDQMVDETDRLARAHAEGDLVKWVKQDEGAPFKVRLLLKQLETLSRALRDLASAQGWDPDEE